MKIYWHLRHPDREAAHPFASSPDPKRLTPLGFPSPWPDRPWIYGVMVASRNGVVAWKRRDKDKSDNPVLAILGIDPAHPAPPRPEQLADKLHVIYLYTFGDVGVGAQTVREQEELVLTIREPGKEVPEFADLYESLHRIREVRGLTRHPRSIIYSPSGKLDFGHPIFTTPGIEVIVVTTMSGARQLESLGAREKGIALVVEGEAELDAAAHRRVHQRLFAEHDVRYLDCMGGETLLQALHEARLLDEVFVTSTDVEIDEAAHQGIKRIFDFKREGAELIAEGRISPESGWVFRRWRFNRR